MAPFAEFIPAELPGWAVEALKQFPVAGVLLVAEYILFRYVTSEHAKHIASKDSEIDRLVKEKKELQSLFIKRLRSTEEVVPKPESGSGKQS